MTRVHAMNILKREGWFERVEKIRRYERIRARVTFLRATPGSASAATLLLDEVYSLVRGITTAEIRVDPREDAVFLDLIIYARAVREEDLRLLVNLCNEHTERTDLPMPCECIVAADDAEEGEAA